jgi:hypothetical protein
MIQALYKEILNGFFQLGKVNTPDSAPTRTYVQDVIVVVTVVALV